MKISCTVNGHSRSVGLKTSTTSSCNHESHSIGPHGSQSWDKRSNFWKNIEPFQIQQLMYHYSFSVHFIEQIFLFMNCIPNIFLTLGNKPGLIFIFQLSHNFNRITNLCLISSFPKDPTFPGEEGGVPDPYGPSPWSVPNFEPGVNVTSLQQHSPSFFFSLFFVYVCMNTVQWGVV